MEQPPSPGSFVTLTECCHLKEGTLGRVLQGTQEPPKGYSQWHGLSKPRRNPLASTTCSDGFVMLSKVARHWGEDTLKMVMVGGSLEWH